MLVLQSSDNAIKVTLLFDGNCLSLESCSTRLTRCDSKNGTASTPCYGVHSSLLFLSVCSLHLSKTCSTSSIVGREDGELAVHFTPSLNTVSISSAYPAYLMQMSVASGILAPDREWCPAHSAREPWSPPSLAFLSVVSSKSTTPKPKTSTFSFTFLV